MEAEDDGMFWERINSRKAEEAAVEKVAFEHVSSISGRNSHRFAG